MEALSDYIDRTGKRVLIEYVLLHDVNDRPLHATQLVQLLTPLRSHVLLNLIPWNFASVGVQYRPPERQAVVEFQRVMQAGGVWCSVRQEMGQDVDGACGQLALKSGCNNNAKGSGVRDIEDIVGGSSAGGGDDKAGKVRRRRLGRQVEEECPSERSSEVEKCAVGTTDVAAERSPDVSFDWRRSFVVFVLPLLVILLLSFHYR